MVPPPRGAFRLSLAATVVVAFGLQILQACSFGSPQAFESPQQLYSILTTAPYVSDATVSGNRWRVIDGAHFKADHGYTCASAPNALQSDKYVGSKLADHATLPKNFDGTVFLNGWYLEYPNGDHHVLGLGAVIFDIQQTGDTLTWHAGGVLSDHYADDAYAWCYQYTVLAWARPSANGKRAFVDMRVAHADATGKLVFVDPKVRSDAFRSQGARFRSKFKPAGKLLAGFGATFDDDDHHLLQFAFDMGETSVKRKVIKWSPDVILKDNSTRTYGTGHLATVVGGASVRFFNPDFTWMESGSWQAPDYVVNDLHLTPLDDSSTCLDFSDTTHTYNYRIDDVPYTWAVPMLTGWDVGLQCDDEHVKKMGAWIESFSFVPNRQTGKGTLYYTVRTVLEDKEPDSNLVDGAQVEILGINLIRPAG